MYLYPTPHSTLRPYMYGIYGLPSRYLTRKQSNQSSRMDVSWDEPYTTSTKAMSLRGNDEIHTKKGLVSRILSLLYCARAR